MMAGARAGPSDSDAVKSAIDASAPPLSMDSKREEETAAGADEPIPQPANADPVGQDQNVVKEKTAVEQTSAPPPLILVTRSAEKIPLRHRSCGRQ